MDYDRLNDWRPLFERALAIVDAAERVGGPLMWSFGGGTVLMLRHRHRYSHDVDIFVPDPQWLGYLSPRLNTVAESLVANFIEGAEFLKLSFPEGEIDFVAAGVAHAGAIPPGAPLRTRHQRRDVGGDRGKEAVVPGGILQGPGPV